MPLDLETLKKSYNALKEVFAVSEDQKRMNQFSHFEVIAIRAGVLKHFEMTYELSWKLIARWLNNNVTPGISDGISRKNLFRLALENRLISDFDRWDHYHEARNDAVHKYSYERAEMIYELIGDFIHDVHDLILALKAQND